MTYFDEKLKTLHEQIARKNKLEVMITELDKERIELTKSARQLEKIKLSEEADYEKLENGGFAAFFLKIFDKLEDKMDKEYREAVAAKLKYDNAIRELKIVEDDLYKFRNELYTLKNCRTEYEKLLSEKSDAIKAQGGEIAERILKLEEEHSALLNQKYEIEEAVRSGNACLGYISRVVEKLNSARNWGIYDAISDGRGADYIKYEKLNEAKNEIDLLQHELRMFRSELADVKITADMDIYIGEGTKFMDFFFDDIFTDWSVMNQISRARDSAENTERQINTVVLQLRTMLSQAEQKLARLKSERDELVKSTKA